RPEVAECPATPHLVEQRQGRCALRWSTPSAERRVGQARISDRAYAGHTKSAYVTFDPPTPRAVATCRPPSTSEGRGGHHSDARIAVVEQRNERGPYRHATDVVLGAVYGIDHPLARRITGQAELLAADRVARSRVCELAAQRLLHRPIGVADRREVGLG